MGVFSKQEEGDIPMSYRPISDYGIIGNMLSAALVSLDGSIDWCCLPHFDSSSVFAAILDDNKGGRFQIKPCSPFQSSQVYLPNTNVLQTTFQTGEGTVTLTDFMPLYQTTRNRLSNSPDVHRRVQCSHGEVSLEIIFQPRLNYGKNSTNIIISKYGVTASDGDETLTLSSLIPFCRGRGKATGQFKLHKGQEAWFVLRHGSSRALSPIMYNPAGKLKRTVDYWEQQAVGCICISRWREPIVRSYLALHLLVYSPTGAIIAPPTTSLPEAIGGERNWDYRYTWLRDASLTLNAFCHLGHTEEGLRFFKWLLGVCTKCGPKTQILYNIEFGDPPDERILDHLKGYRNSRPVRIGNDAYRQRQLDVFGEVLEAAYNYLNVTNYIGHHDWELLASFVDAAADLWRQPDSGIWEVRGGPYHFVHSKLLCWVALDRGIKIAEKLGYPEDLRSWRQTARDIRDDILTRGWNPQQGAFTQHYDTTNLDASNLFMPLYGFLPSSDERIISTVERTVAELSTNGLLRRYNTGETDDGLGGSEGAFLWCSFWLVRNRIRQGKLDEATALYDKLLSYGNHLGLLSEMVDPITGEALGNFPQALTHLAIIITGLELTQAIEEKNSGGSRR